MSLIERDYMGESYEERMKERGKNEKHQQQQDELWRLYNKEKKNFFDRRKIKKIEKANLKRANKGK